ncbi:MAG: hypothetical protein QOG87_3561 [Actinomycetota bacterium]|jgi:putative nucleotidyltransferase with HDIG domain
MGSTTEREASGWAARPGLALAVRAIALGVPLVLGVAAAVVVTRALPRPDGPAELARIWVTGFAVSTAVGFGATRALRRLLPLAALLELSLTFPDQTPSRMRVALRAGNLKKPAKHGIALHTARDGSRKEAVEAVLALAAALSAHDRATRGHSERVRAYTDMLAEELHVSAEDRLRLRWASLLHDVGKMSVPADVLNKPGKLDDGEWKILHRHPTEGAKLTAALAPWLGPWAATIEHHHERWDGKGYPAGLSGTEIQQGARIVAVADAYEVMTAARAYKAPLPATEARRRLAADAGKQFDPDVVRAFLNLSLGRLRVAAGPLTWLAQVPFLRPISSVSRTPVGASVLGVTLAAAAVTLAMPTVPPDIASTVASAPRGVVRQRVELVTSAPPPPVPTAVLAATASNPRSTPPTAGSPTLATEVEPPQSAVTPTPPPAGPTPAPDAPPTPAPQPPTPWVRAAVEVGEPVDAVLAVGVGDSADPPLPLPPVDVTLTIPPD